MVRDNVVGFRSSKDMFFLCFDHVFCLSATSSTARKRID
jgi:hypothetical protein